MKLGIVGLISLFAWNALFGAFGGLLLCIHQDLELHAEELHAEELHAEEVNEELAAAAAAAAASSCVTDHCLPNQADACLATGECCIDIELPAELLPVVRFKSDVSSAESLVLLAIFIDCLRAPEPSRSLVFQCPGPRVFESLPESAWLTEYYLQTTVLRV
ncbi:hypothetical protein QEH52_00275 [Coraliomargarita sp. SDUM461003]|uniref:Secreted protein n=1 Tax=Thalassobacterium maritimum TaxID=3041265 RepID=A0ABU1ARQ3_9BACT|nr:hypothetical protein [Coraliomargarita sp. SDUM461003]MDQ8205929.1 hypothetical protein [Coraliomargarita sp. SDUM461003]